ncbi:MAG TPA: dienelactone hydrolase family protein [Desertimonas sp.]|nr:dienelactone hydrolase family protein [Desertimonas sp.]
MTDSRVDSVELPDGKMDVHVWLPASGRGPGLTLIPAIFGLSTHIRTVAGRLTDAGYVVGVPDLFWRFAPGWQADADEAGLAASMATAARLDRDGAVDDCGAVLEHLAALPDVGGDPGVIGFCLGGTLAFGTAIRYEPSVCVSYYGSGVVGLLDGIGDVNCPTLLHFGSRDQSIPGEAVEQIAAATDGRANIAVNVEIAGHAFDDEAPMFHDEGAARSAWSKTMAVLAEHLPVS